MFWNRKRARIRVEFVDNATKTVFAQTDISPESLPASFEAETTMHLGNQDWLVVSAMPMTSAEFRKSGHLRLVMDRIKHTTIDPSKLLFSIPTISDGLPAPAEGTTKIGRRVLELHEDDWRQIEFYDLALESLVEGHLAAVRDVHATARSGPGFTRIHVRKACEDLLAGAQWSLRELERACPPGSDVLDGIAFRGLAGIVTGGFAIRLPSLASLYGTTRGTRVETLAVHPPDGKAFDVRDIDGLENFGRERRLGVVNWCAAQSAML
jgi:hypothetical protein